MSSTNGGEPRNASSSTQPYSIINALAEFRRLLTVREVALLLGVSECTVYREAARKNIPSVMVSGSRKFDPATLAMWLIKKEPQLALAARVQKAA